MRPRIATRHPSVRLMLSILALAGLAAGLCGCGSSSPGAAANRPVSAPRSIQLPHDNAMHPGAQTEWWYFVGHLTDRQGHAFGFETTLFKFHNLRIPGSARPITIYRYDVSLSDIHGRHFLPTVTYVEPGIAPVHLSSTSFAEHVGTTRVWSASGVYHLASRTKGTHLLLSMTTHRAPLLEGGSGFVPMGSHGSSYYYSLTHLHTSGQIYYRGQWIPVHGVSWMDHQWGTWQWSQIHGWTWGGFHLDNGVDFSLSDFHTAGRSLHGVSVSYPSGMQRTVHRVLITKLGTWKSPNDGAVYSSGWKVTIPAIKANLTVVPLLKNQEVYDRLAPPESYWEGACRVSGTFMGKPVTGHAYIELVGASGHFGSF